MANQILQSIWNANQPMTSKATQQSHSTCGNVLVLFFLFLPEFVMCYFLWCSNVRHKINLYYSCMVLFPVLFIIASGSVSAYVSLLRNMYQRCSWRTLVIAAGTGMFGFAIQNLCFLLALHHTEWVHYGASAWQDVGNLVFLCVNPAMETFFWRVFLHRELALRWFPSKSQSDERLLSLTTGTPVLPRLSPLGMLVNGAAFSMYHYVPIVLYDLPLYSHVGMTYHMALGIMVWLGIFGVLAIQVREKLGIVAAWTLHLGVDISDVLMYTYVMIKMTGHPSAKLFASWE